MEKFPINLKLIFSYLIKTMACLSLRLLRFFPNNDPIIGFVLPLSKSHNPLGLAFFAFLNMFLFDLIVGRFGIWTWVTALTYAVIALVYGSYLNRKNIGFGSYLKHAIIAVVIFDFITGPVMGSMLFKISFFAASAAQVPFTLMHVLSGSFYTLVFAPIIDPQLRSELVKKLKLFGLVKI